MTSLLTGLWLPIAFVAVALTASLLTWLRATTVSRRRIDGPFRDFAEIAADWLWETNADGRIIYFFSRGTDNHIPPGNETHSRTERPVSDSVVGLVERHIGNIAERSQAFRDFVFSSQSFPDGPSCWWRISGRPLFDPAGRYLGHRGILSEITHQVELVNPKLVTNPGVLDLLEEIPEAVAIFDTRDRLTFCNENYRRLYPATADLIASGVLFEDLVRANAARGSFPLGPGTVRDAWIEDRIAAHKMSSYLAEQHLSDGRWIQVRERRTADGSIVGVWTDITEIKHREEALLDSESRNALATSQLLNIIETIPEGIAIYDTDDRLALCNQRYRDLYPVVADLIAPGITFLDLVRATFERGAYKLTDAERQSFLAQRLAQHRNPDSITEQHLSDDRWIQIHERRMKDGSIVGVWSDITAIKHREEVLRESEDRYAIAMESTSEGLWHWDVLRDEVYIAPRLAAIIGITAPDSKKARLIFDKHVHPDDQLRRQHAFLEHLKGGSSSYRCEYRLRRADGSYLWVLDTGLARRDQDGRVYRMAGSVADISARRNQEIELRRAKEQAESASRTKTEFLANVSHELRTPLNAVIGFSDIIRHELLGPIGKVKYREYADDIYNSGMHLLDVINDILDVAKIEAGKVELHEETVGVDQCAQAALRLVKQRASANAVHLECNVPADLPPLRADDRKVKQILINLLSNGVKFTPSGGYVAISALLTATGAMRITVQDTGIGIAKEDIQKALSPFGQVDSHLARKYQGTGLGLSLVQALVALHGASFNLTSEAGCGTTVTVEFPPERVLLASATVIVA